MEHFIWNINPDIFTWGPLHLRWYGVLFVGSFFLGLYLMRCIYQREGKDPAIIEEGLIYVLLGAVIGARLVHCFAYEPEFYLSHPLEIFKVWKGGLASHGGIIGVMIALWLFAKKYHEDFLWLLARITIPGLLAASFIRLGNFFNSEILGLPTDKSWAIIFSRIDMQPRHPVQLYEAAAYFVLFFLFLYLYKKLSPLLVTRLFPGLLLFSVFTVRFFLEYVKTRQADYHWDLPLSTGQALSLPFIVIGLLWILWAFKSRSYSTS